nr:hypothetical protein [Tanacetum cinerariifolium]
FPFTELHMKGKTEAEAKDGSDIEDDDEDDIMNHGVAVVVVLWFWSCRAAVVVLLRWWFSSGVVVMVDGWWFCGGGATCFSLLVNTENYQDDDVSLTSRTKLKLIKVIGKIFRNTLREQLFRNTCFGWLLDIDESQKNCVLIHFMSFRQGGSLPEDTDVVSFTYHLNGHFMRKLF